MSGTCRMRGLFWLAVSQYWNRPCRPAGNSAVMVSTASRLPSALTRKSALKLLKTTGSSAGASSEPPLNTSGHRSPNMMSTNGIDHPITRRMPPPVKLRCRILALPYVQRVDLHPNGLLIVPRAEHAGGPAQRRRQLQAVATWDTDQHSIDRAGSRNPGGPAGSQREVDGSEKLRGAWQVSRFQQCVHGFGRAVDGGDVDPGRQTDLVARTEFGLGVSDRIPADQRLHRRNRRL